MTAPSEQIVSRDEPTGVRTVRTTAKVAGVLSIVFFILLIGNFIGSAVIGPWRENRLTAMKERLHAEPDNETLLGEIRELDLAIRRNRIWRLDFARKAAYMLLGSAVLFLIAGKIGSLLEKSMPAPRPRQDLAAEQIKLTHQARWAVTGTVPVLAAGVLLLAMSGPLVFVQIGDGELTEPAFATMQEKSMQWPRFRGAGGSGTSVYTNTPMRWDGSTGDGILWKTQVPLPGKNSPVVWNDRVFLAGATREARQVYCFDANSGELLWTGDVPTVPGLDIEELSLDEDETGYSASTVATDGYRVYAIFPTGDTAGFDFNGRRLWHKNLGAPDTAYGYGTSLETYRGNVIVQYDQGHGNEGLSRLYAFDGPTGQVTWEVRRDVPNSWATPTIVDVEGRLQLITLSDPWAIAYDPNTGAEIWRADCLGTDVAPSPVYAGGLVFATEPYSETIAIRPTGEGDVTETHIAWTTYESAPDICSPVSDGTRLYILDGTGYFVCCNLADGQKVYHHDFRQNFMASPSIASERLYLLSDKGVMHIADLGAEYNEIATCELGENCYASPAFADGRIYIRGEENLYCITGVSSQETVD
jgi:outer membrane protein assembly factor BamB